MKVYLTTLFGFLVTLSQPSFAVRGPMNDTNRPTPPQSAFLLEKASVLKEISDIFWVEDPRDLPTLPVTATVGLGTISLGLQSLSMGAPQVLGKGLIFAGASMATFGAAGLIIYIFKPVEAQSGTLTDYYMTPEGFPHFLELTPEQMVDYATMDPKLAEFMVKFADSIEQARRAP